MTYLQLLLELPWNDVTKDNLDLKCAREQLDHDHFGLDEVKERLLEHLAVIKLKGDLKSPILCLYGPPGVGKTSLGKSVAAALELKFGLFAGRPARPESEIHGHRRTYIGAMPGRIIQTIKRCGSSNPVIILDGWAKVDVSNHDPSAPCWRSRSEQKHHVPRQLPRHGVRPVEGAVHLQRQQRGQYRPGAARPHGDDQHRRLPPGGEGAHRAGPPAAQAARGPRHQGAGDDDDPGGRRERHRLLYARSRRAFAGQNLAKIAHARAKQIAFDEAFAPRFR